MTGAARPSGRALLGRDGAQITARDRAILGWIGRHGVVTAEQVARKFFARDDGAVGKRAAYRRLAILENVGLLRRDPTPFHRAPHVIRITSAGAALGEVAVAPARLVESEIRHSLALVDLCEQLEAANGGSALRTERELRTDRWKERNSGTRKPARGRTADAELTLRDGTLVGIELDLTPKRSVDYERVLNAYKQEPFTRVWWYVVSGAVPRLQRLVANNRADDFIEVRAWDDGAIPPPSS